MKEKRDAQQAYKSAMEKMKMPAQLDCDKEIISSGTGRIKMKSRVLACTAAAAVLAVCVAVGAIVIHNKNSDDKIKTSTSSNYKLEDDQTIPSGEIKSVEQAVEEHQKCLLLENDEYIRLETNKDNITKQMAQSFTERTEKLTERDKQCVEYIEKNDKSDQVQFVHAILYDDGNISLSYHISDNISEETKRYLDTDNFFRLIDAKTAETVLNCSAHFSDTYRKNSVVYSPLDMNDTKVVEKLKGELSLVVESKKSPVNTVTLIKSLKFFDKAFIGTDERARLKQLAAKAMDKQDSSSDSTNYENSLNITADKVVCSQHGMYIQLVLTPNNENGKKALKNYNSIFIRGDNNKEIPEPDTNLGKIINKAGFSAQAIEIGQDKVAFDIIYPITSTPDKNFGLNLNAVVPSSSMPGDDNGQDGKIIGSIKVKYEKPMQEREFICGNKKILLSDLCLVVSDSVDRVSDITLTRADGSQEMLSEKDFSDFGLECRGVNEKGADKIADSNLKKSFAKNDFSNDELHANYITNTVDTSKVTSIIYAGEEYKLPQSEENTQTQSSEYKTLGEAQEAFSKAYTAQLNILEKYKNDKDKLAENDIRELCNEFVSELDIMGKAGAAIGKYEQGTLLARRTTANELIVYMWNDYNIGFASGSTVNGQCDIIDPNGKVTASGELELDYIGPPTNASYNRYMLKTIAFKGSDLSALVAISEKNYNLAIHDNAGGVKNFEFNLAADETEMSMEERTLLMAKLYSAAHYGEFKTQK